MEEKMSVLRRGGGTWTGRGRGRGSELDGWGRLAKDGAADVYGTKLPLSRPK